MPGSITTVERRSGRCRASRPHGGPQRRPIARSSPGRSLVGVTSAENFYDYANQDPVNGYDLAGTMTGTPGSTGCEPGNNFLICFRTRGPLIAYAVTQSP